MICHVLPGDSLVEEFRKTRNDGEIIVCREALIAGPIDAENLDEFWERRARFVLSEYGEDEIEYHERVAEPLSRLTELTADDEVNLWFEYELFCSVNLWFCLSLLVETDATVYRVEPTGLENANRWDGFGQFKADDLAAAFRSRRHISQAEIEFGAALWNAYRNDSHGKLRELANDEQPAFPYLKEIVKAAVEQDIRPREVVREIIASGETDFGKVFAEFKTRAGVYGYGDMQVQRLIGESAA